MRAFEYLHIYIYADKFIQAGESTRGYESGEIYVSELVSDQLNKLGQVGWELVNITPKYYSVDAPYSMPDYIEGWYCTFKRSLA